MNTAIERVQNNVKVAIEKFINHVEESEMKLTTKNTAGSNRFNGYVPMKPSAKLLTGLAMGVMPTWAGFSSYNALADGPNSPLVTAQQSTVQSEVQHRFVQPSNSFTAEELLVIQAEIEDGYDGTVTSPIKQVDMSNAGGDRTVLQALQSHDVGSVFSAEEWLQILSEMEDTV